MYGWRCEEEIGVVESCGGMIVYNWV